MLPMQRKRIHLRSTSTPCSWLSGQQGRMQKPVEYMQVGLMDHYPWLASVSMLPREHIYAFGPYEVSDV